MVINTEKGDKCPICYYQILAPNCWVRFHVKYKPEVVVLSCRYCNYCEFLLRNKIMVNSSRVLKRIPSVIAFQKKFNVIM